jgi:hypothetical protein
MGWLLLLPFMILSHNNAPLGIGARCVHNTGSS